MANLLRLALRGFSRSYGALVGLASDTRPFLDPADFPWIAQLEANWEAIRDELLALLDGRRLPILSEVLPGETAISDERWKAIFFRIWNTPIEQNLHRCPRTAELLASVPEMTTAMFSILDAGTHVPPHRGPFRGVIRYHLGLVIPPPEGSVRLRVLDEIRTWEEGRSLLFDDTYEHEVWNDSTRPRAVLFLDVKRPLPAPFRWLNNTMIALLAALIIRPTTKFEHTLPDQPAGDTVESTTAHEATRGA